MSDHQFGKTLLTWALLPFCLTPWGVRGEYVYQPCENQPNYCLAAGANKSLYHQLAQDLVERVAKEANMDMPDPNLPPLVVKSSGGSIENALRMRYQLGVQMAMVQSDVLLYFTQASRRGDKGASQIANQLRVVLPLFNEEIHVLVRRDSPITWLHELRGKRLAVGNKNSGSALTGRLLHKLLTTYDMDDSQIYTSSGDNAFEDALSALLNKEVDAWIWVDGAPSSRLQQFPAQVGEIIKLVKVDFNNESTLRWLQGPYYKGNIPKGSYPWLEEDVPTLSVKTFLVSKANATQHYRDNLVRFVKSACRNLPVLQREGHEKWRQITWRLDRLAGGWQYAAETETAFRAKECQPGCSGERALFHLCDQPPVQ